MKLIHLVLLALLALFAGYPFRAAAEETFRDRVVVIPVGEDSLTSKQSFGFMNRILKRAQEEQARAVVFDLNTPGGLAWETSEMMMKSIQPLTIPTYAYVNPRAMSAGALISAACDKIYMAPVSSIGAAGIITSSGEEMDPVMRKKAESAFWAFTRSVVTEKGYRPEVVKAMMIPSDQEQQFGPVKLEKGALLTLTGKEAAARLEDGRPLLAQGTASSVTDLLAQEKVNAPVVTAEPTAFERIGLWIAWASPIMILLGIGGIRALRQLGIKHDVFHCNEGHAAFIGVERIRDLVNHRKLSFSEALEVVRSSSLFTTHTPVPAGHDAFPESMIRQYMSHYPDVLGITWEQYINLGKTNPNDPNEKFSMSVLACNLSQEVNGVSWLHGEVSKEILGNMWPGYFKNELHIGYVTNGVHFPTWIASSLRRLYARYFGDGFEGHVYDIPAWQKVHDIPDAELWEERMKLKNKLIKHIRRRYSDPRQVRLDSPRQMLQVIEGIKPDVLTIGFARRFATYKRAYLLFTNLDRLAAIVNNKERPVQFIFAGKAHPNDKPGQDLIRRIVEVAAMPQFVGKILFLQNYDMELARRMVQGVDVWLNTPTRPLEASGTSGEKCVMNGVLQFSVLDGWWVEGYKEGAGWMLPMERTFADQHYQDELDAEMIYNTIEEQIAPKYYARDTDGIPHEWVSSVKRCVADIASNFTTNRMLTDYENRFYDKLAARKREMSAEAYRMAREIAAWKRKVSAAWDQVRIVDVQRVKIDKEAVCVGEKYQFAVTLDIANLRPEDIGVEMVVARQIVGGQSVNVTRTIQLERTKADGSRVTYSLDYTPDEAGTFDVALRIYPSNPLLPHRMDFALVKWA